MPDALLAIVGNADGCGGLLARSEIARALESGIAARAEYSDPFSSRFSPEPFPEDALTSTRPSYMGD